MSVRKGYLSMAVPGFCRIPHTINNPELGLVFNYVNLTPYTNRQPDPLRAYMGKTISSLQLYCIKKIERLCNMNTIIKSRKVSSPAHSTALSVGRSSIKYLDSPKVMPCDDLCQISSLPLPTTRSLFSLIRLAVPQMS